MTMKTVVRKSKVMIAIILTVTLLMVMIMTATGQAQAATKKKRRVSRPKVTTQTQVKNQTQEQTQEQDRSQEPRWIWNVLVFPPESGWDSEPGLSIKTVLEWHTVQISESGTGASGHDIQFVRLPPVSEEDAEMAQTVNLPINQNTIAVMSFAGEHVNRVLIQRLAGKNIPLMLANGENNLINPEQGGAPIPNIFALDLYRDYRSSAFARYAEKTLTNKNARIALAATRFTVNQEREAKICDTMLSDLGFMPLPYWTDSSVNYTFGMMTQEVQSAADGVLVTFLGEMGAKEMWRGFMRVKTRWQLWNCTRPDETWLSCVNMFFADQNFLLPEHGGFSELARRMWTTRVMRIDNLVAGGRADALVEWLLRGISNHAPAPVDNMNQKQLLRALENVTGIPFGIQKLDISPELHRPRSRLVCITQVRDRKLNIIDTFAVDGLRYAPNY